MAQNALTIFYSDEILQSLQESPDEFEANAKLLLALKLYELGRLTTGRAAELAGVSRVEFIFVLGKHGLSPLGVDPEELDRDLMNA